jgi:hypothetical protein
VTPPSASAARSAFAGTRTLLIAALPHLAASAASAQALPEIRLTPAAFPDGRNPLSRSQKPMVNSKMKIGPA